MWAQRNMPPVHEHVLYESFCGAVRSTITSSGNVGSEKYVSCARTCITHVILWCRQINNYIFRQCGLGEICPLSMNMHYTSHSVVQSDQQLHHRALLARISSTCVPNTSGLCRQTTDYTGRWCLLVCPLAMCQNTMGLFPHSLWTTHCMDEVW